MNHDEAPKKIVSAVRELTWKVPEECSEASFANRTPGVFIKSKMFTVLIAGVETKWFLDLRPNCYKEGNKTYIGLFLQSASALEAECIDFKVTFRFGVVKKVGENHYLNSEYKHSKYDMKRFLVGSYQLLSHEDLFKEENGYVVNKTLAILVNLKVEHEVPNPGVLNGERKNGCKQVFENRSDQADLILVVKGEQVLEAHSEILKAHASKFFKILEQKIEVKDGKNSVDVKDIDSKVMKEVLRFIYYNEVDGLEDIAPDLICAANKYEVNELKNYCIKKMLADLTVGNVIARLVDANSKGGAEELSSVCVDFILNNYITVKQQPSWENLQNDLMTKILDALFYRNYHLTI